MIFELEVEFEGINARCCEMGRSPQYGAFLNVDSLPYIPMLIFVLPLSAMQNR